MILFAEDWRKYPNAIIHSSTKNRSFVRQAAVYRQMGIKNHAFLLALHDPELLDVDPFDLDRLDETTILRIMRECKTNPWYFVREIAQAPARGTFNGTPVEANRGNIALWWSYFNHIWITLIQPRQTGKSMSTDVLMELLMNVMCQYTTIHLLTKDDKLRVENVQRLRGMMELLPPYMYLKSTGDSENNEEVSINRLHNKYKTHVPRPSPRDANNMGRGMTTPTLHIDEPPFQRNIDIALGAALPGLGAAWDIAKAAGTPYGVIMTTTAGNKEDKSGKFIYNLLQRSAVWTERFFDAVNEEDLRKMVQMNSIPDEYGNVPTRINATFSHRQLGKSDEWMRSKLVEFEQTVDAANADYFNVWSSGGKGTPFKTDVAKVIRNSIREAQFVEISEEGYAIHWQIRQYEIEARMRDGKFFMGMDTSNAAGRDGIGMLLIDIETGETIAAGSYNATNTTIFGTWLGKLLVRFENIVANIESRSTGIAFMDTVMMILYKHGIDPFRRLFNRAVDEYLENPERLSMIRQTPEHRRDLHFYAQNKALFGFPTAGSGKFSRDNLYGNVLQQAVQVSAHLMRDERLVTQTLGLVIKNGRIDHESDSHDDMTIAWLMAMWMLFHAKNLEYYGIDPRRVLSKMKAYMNRTVDEVEDDEEQEELREQLDDLTDRLLKEVDPFVSLKIEQQMRLIFGKIELDSSDIRSVDQLIREVNDQKRKAPQTTGADRILRDQYARNNAYENAQYRYR